MDAQSLIKLPFNFKILQTDSHGVPKIPSLPFVAMFNPEQFAIKEDIKWDTPKLAGSTSYDPTFMQITPRTFSVDLTIDGTGVNTNGVKIPVTAQVALFRAVTTTYDGTIHRPSYLMVQYGTFICTCILNTSTVTYTMFDMFGLPIRAKITASFTERIIPGLSNVLNMLSSPDLTHKVEVKEGDLLPLKTYEIYKNQNYYLQVARVNKLKNFRKLKANTVLTFPPVS